MKMEHSLEELKRQYDAAVSRKAQAEKEEREAKARYMEAMFAATGFKGCVAEFTQNYGSRLGQAVQFTPIRMGPWGRRIQGPMIKKDGSIGERVVDCDLGAAKNLGPYVPPTK